MEVDTGKRIHFETVDYKGRKIICTERQWKHVCKKPHEYMEGQEDEVIETLQKPDYGIRHIDVDDPNYRRVYYMTHSSKEWIVKVIVKFKTEECEEYGEIVTAYETNNIKEGEKPEFPK